MIPRIRRLRFSTQCSHVVNRRQMILGLRTNSFLCTSSTTVTQVIFGPLGFFCKWLAPYLPKFADAPCSKNLVCRQIIFKRNLAFDRLLGGSSKIRHTTLDHFNLLKHYIGCVLVTRIDFTVLGSHLNYFSDIKAFQATEDLNKFNDPSEQNWIELFKTHLDGHYEDWARSMIYRCLDIGAHHNFLSRLRKVLT